MLSIRSDSLRETMRATGLSSVCEARMSMLSLWAFGELVWLGSLSSRRGAWLVFNVALRCDDWEPVLLADRAYGPDLGAVDEGMKPVMRSSI